MNRASFFEPLTRIDVVSGQKEVDWCNERDNCDDQGRGAPEGSEWVDPMLELPTDVPNITPKSANTTIRHQQSLFVLGTWKDGTLGSIRGVVLVVIMPKTAVRWGKQQRGGWAGKWGRRRLLPISIPDTELAIRAARRPRIFEERKGEDVSVKWGRNEQSKDLGENQGWEFQRPWREHYHDEFSGVSVKVFHIGNHIWNIISTNLNNGG